MSRRIIETAWIIILTMLLLAPSCAKHGEGNPSLAYMKGEGGMTNSGSVDLSVPAAPPMEQGNAGYDSEYRESTRSAAPASAPAPPSAEMLAKPEAMQQLTGGVTAGPQQNTLAEIERWFSPQAYAADNTPAEEYLIRTGNITLKVDSYDKVAQQVSDVAAKYKGVVTDSQMNKSADGTKSGYVILRVPKESFFTAWDELLKLGEVENQNQAAQDVARDYIATWSQIKNLTTEQETLRAMLADAREVQRTRGLGEAYNILLQTEQRLSEVTGELQSASDQFARLADQINRSTITVNLSERAVYQSTEFKWNTGEVFRQAWKDLLLGFRNTVNGVVYFLVTMWLWLIPLAVVALVVWLILRRVIRAGQSRQRSQDATKQ